MKITKKQLEKILNNVNALALVGPTGKLTWTVEEPYLPKEIYINDDLWGDLATNR